MKTVVKKAAVTFLKFKEQVTRNPTRYLFVLGHMRSGSSLLHHLLISHPDLLGCGERNMPYHTAADLHHLTIAARYHRRAFFQPYRYIVDQINHNHFVPDTNLLNHPHIWKIFLIREPAAALSSMVRVLGKHYGTTLDEALTHYLGRLERLSQYAQAIANPGRATFLTYDDLVNHIEPTLSSLQTFLQLEAPLSPHYQRFDFTGKRGDPSPHIQQGMVQKHPPSTLIDIPAYQLDQAQLAYENALQTLKKHFNQLGT